MCTQFAMDTSHRITHISEAERGLACNCFCVVCGESMMAKKGSEREHHFAHESNKTACVVNHESLLHRFAKRVIKEAGGLVVPPSAKHRLDGLPSVSRTNSSWLMLARIEEEKVLGDIRPDLIGYFGRTPVLIEVAYSSFADLEKQAKLKARGLVALEIDLRAFPPDTFDPQAAQNAILNEYHQKTWICFPEVAQTIGNPACIVETVTIKGIWVSARDLPFGDLAIKVTAFNPEVNAIVRTIAKRYYGRWKQEYKNWIVPGRWLQQAKNDLRAAADAV